MGPELLGCRRCVLELAGCNSWRSIQMMANDKWIWWYYSVQILV